MPTTSSSALTVSASVYPRSTLGGGGSASGSAACSPSIDVSAVMATNSRSRRDPPGRASNAPACASASATGRETFDRRRKSPTSAKGRSMRASRIDRISEPEIPCTSFSARRIPYPSTV